MSSPKEKIVEARRNLAKKATNFRTAFSTPAGAQVLQDLKDEFNPDIIARKGMDPTAIIIGAAHRDVLNYINLMINFEENENAKLER